MLSTYRFKKLENNREVEITEAMLLQLIKLAKERKKPLYDKLVKVWEELEGRNFDEKYLE